MSDEKKIVIKAEQEKDTAQELSLIHICKRFVNLDGMMNWMENKTNE